MKSVLLSILALQRFLGLRKCFSFTFIKLLWVRVVYFDRNMVLLTHTLPQTNSQDCLSILALIASDVVGSTVRVPHHT